MKPMATLHDLIEEAKVRALWWGICVFGITYFLSNTSKSMWLNLPISILILCAFRYVSYEVELRWKVRPITKQSYLSHLQKKQLSLHDPRLSTLPSMPTWKRKVDSPLVEAAVKDFIDKLLQDFVVNLWYSSITPDKEAPELIRALILDAIGEVSLRIRDINLVDLLTRDMIELIGNHLDLFRRNQSIIGVEVMKTLSSEERDERLKHHLLASRELHPALISSECEYKTLQRIVGGILAIVLNQREVQCPLIRCFARELLTCLVMEPVMNLASPGYINELIELIILNSTVDTNKGVNTTMEASTATLPNSTSTKEDSHINKLSIQRCEAHNQPTDTTVESTGEKLPSSTTMDIFQEDQHHSLHPKPADWARVLDAATQRRTQVLAPENLENLWTKGRNYKKKTAKLATALSAEGPLKTSRVLDNYVSGGATKEMLNNVNIPTTSDQERHLVQLHESVPDTNTTDSATSSKLVSKSLNEVQSVGADFVGLEEGGRRPSKDTRYQLKRSSSTSDLKSQKSDNKKSTGRSGEAVFAAEHLKQDFKGAVGSVSISERPLHLPKLKCRVVGAYFEKIGSNSFAVYSIAVTDAENKTWFVKRRYRNFERLHRHLKDIPNYTLHLPPKRFLSSSIDDYFVHQRCILLDKYLKDLLSIANIAEQHEVWDFLSSSSKNYSFGKSTSVMKTLAVNVDDAMDDIVRQFRGVSNGLRQKVSSSSSSLPNTVSPSTSEKSMSLTWNEDENSKHSLENSNVGMSHSLSDDEVNEDEGSAVSNSGWHSDNELNSKGLPPRILKHNDRAKSVGSQESESLGKLEEVFLDHSYMSKPPGTSAPLGDPETVPPEWSPPNVSVPILNLVDNIFQLKKRGWLRRQVFWISKQILQLVMEDAIDDWLVRQIHWIRRDDIVAGGIRWLQDVLWPNGEFFIKLENNKEKDDEIERNQNMASSSTRARKSSKPVSFEEQLEAARRASEVKKILLGGAPTTLVSLIGNKQYRHCARDIYYFLQSSVCIKQLAYGMLELVVISIFPELHDLMLDVHQKNAQHT